VEDWGEAVSPAALAAEDLAAGAASAAAAEDLAAAALRADGSRMIFHVAGLFRNKRTDVMLCAAKHLGFSGHEDEILRRSLS
jgi:hypothetical protein